ncbi:oxygenase MpaB family protein [Candidatus Palauibacter sp.]|uniref:oxygenase MpaB family protein n=1 Tax=Candidatus Palauibacter sp. TaxID=3101350 RepID=UPI003B52EB23
MEIPSCYADGYEKARKVDPVLARLYIRHTTVGDPAADAVIDEMAGVSSPARVHRIISAALENYHDMPSSGDGVPGHIPDALQNLIADAAVVPGWYDPKISRVATRAFLNNSDMVLGALVGGAIIEGFSTLISKSFRIRSRIMTNGVRRLKQNLLQLVEQYLPGGIEPGGDGWKLSLRIRLVHAQVRRMLRDFDGTTDVWDQSVHGLPLHASHMLLGASAFSARLMQHVSTLGGDLSDRDVEAYVHVWRYTGHLMGVPDEILFRDFESAVRWFEIGSLCEPPPDEDGIIMANSIINSAPIVLGFTEPEERRAMARYLYQVSRELIGDSLADDLNYPPGRWKKEIPRLRLRNFGDRILRRFGSVLSKRRSRQRFTDMLNVSDLGGYEHSYRLPTSVFEEDSDEW